MAGIVWNVNPADDIRNIGAVGIARMLIDIKRLASPNSPFVTGALRSTGRIQHANLRSELKGEVVFGGTSGFGSAGYRLVDYAEKTHDRNKTGQDRYLAKAGEAIGNSDLTKYFGG